jgi:hypothetical protein
LRTVTAAIDPRCRHCAAPRPAFAHGKRIACRSGRCRSALLIGISGAPRGIESLHSKTISRTIGQAGVCVRCNTRTHCSDLRERGAAHRAPFDLESVFRRGIIGPAQSELPGAYFGPQTNNRESREKK